MDCPKCGSKVPFTLKDAGSIIKCPKCSTEIELSKDENFDNVKDSVDDSFDEFENNLKNFGK